MTREDVVIITDDKDCKFNLDFLSDDEKKSLAEATLKAVRRFLAQPGGKEYLEKRCEERKKREKEKAVSR